MDRVRPTRQGARGLGGWPQPVELRALIAADVGTEDQPLAGGWMRGEGHPLSAEGPLLKVPRVQIELPHLRQATLVRAERQPTAVGAEGATPGGADAQVGLKRDRTTVRG